VPHPGELVPRGVEVALGALGAGAQVGARLLEYLGAGFHRGAQFVALAGGVGAELLELGGVRPGHLGQAGGGVVEPGEDLVPFPLRVGAQLVGVTGGVFPDSRGFCAGVLGPGVGGRSALVCLRGLREGLVACVPGGVNLRLGLCACTPDCLLRLRLGAAGALLGRRDRGGLVRLGRCDRAVPVFLGDGDARLGLLADLLEFGGVRGGGFGQPVVRLAGAGLRGFQVLAHLLGGLVGCGAGLVGDRGAALGVGSLGLGGRRAAPGPGGCFSSALFSYSGDWPERRRRDAPGVSAVPVSPRALASSARAASRSCSARSARARRSARDSSSTWARDSIAARSSSRSRAASARARRRAPWSPRPGGWRCR
jgi:hypothetical protein